VLFIVLVLENCYVPEWLSDSLDNAGGFVASMCSNISSAFDWCLACITGSDDIPEEVRRLNINGGGTGGGTGAAAGGGAGGRRAGRNYQAFSQLSQ